MRNISNHLASIQPGYKSLKEWFERRNGEPFYLGLDQKWSLLFEENGEKAHITLLFNGMYAREFSRGIPLRYEDFDLDLEGIEKIVDEIERKASAMKNEKKVVSYPLAVYELLFAVSTKGKEK